MSKLLIFNPNPDIFGRHSIPTTYIASVLKENGHEVELFDTTFMDISYLLPKKDAHEELNYSLNFFKNADYSNLNIEKKKVDVIKLFQDKIDSFMPDLITFSFWGSHLYAEGEFWAYFNGLKIINGVDLRGTPVAVGGTAPTWDTDVALGQPQIDYVVRGEPEFVYLDIMNNIDSGSSLSGIKNLWIKNGEGVYEKNELRPLIRPLDTLPFADYDIYDDRIFWRPYHGKMVRCIDAETSRGCLYECTFCLSPFQRNTYGVNKGEEGFPTSFRREKTVGRITDEFSYIKNRHKLDLIRFQDETFLSLKADKLKELSSAYKKHVGVPFIVEATIPSITEEKLHYLKKMGCVSLSLGLESGSPELRKFLKKPHITNDNIVKNLAFVKKSGISYNLFNMVGFPNENEDMIWETINLNRKVKPPYAQISHFQPWEGTPLRDYAVKEGLLDPNSRGLDNSQDTLTISKLKNLPISQEKIMWYHNVFSYYIYLPEFLFPLINQLKNHNMLSKFISKFLKGMIKLRWVFIR